MQAAFDLKPHVTKMLKAETYQKRLCQGYCLVWACVLSCSSKSTAGGWEYQAPTANYSAATRPLTAPKHCLSSQESVTGHSLGLHQHFKSIQYARWFSASAKRFIKLLPYDNEKTKQNSMLIHVCIHSRCKVPICW